MIKKYYVFVVVLMLVALNAFAIDYPEPTSWVNDYAGVLTDEQKQELDTFLKYLETATTNQVFVSIMETLPVGITLEEYVNELFERWQPGQKGKDNGVLLAIFINDRKLRIEVGYGLEERLTDATSKLIIANDIAPAFKQGNYYAGIGKGLESIVLTISPGYTFIPIKIPGYQPPPRPSETEPENETSTGLQIAIIVFIIINGIVLIRLLWNIIKGGGFSSGRTGSSRGWSRRSRSSSRRSRSSSRRSRSSSSSWSSSSSGFSGGGGGSSGGGGASGSW
jgi:uncharacterized protein